jgi:hypothetical protein
MNCLLGCLSALWPLNAASKIIIELVTMPDLINEAAAFTYLIGQIKTSQLFLYYMVLPTYFTSQPAKVLQDSIVCYSLEHMRIPFMHYVCPVL